VPWALAAIVAALVLVSWSRTRTTTSPVTRFEIRPAFGTQFGYPINGVAMYLALSPDGRQVIYTGSRGGSDWALYIRDLDQLDSRLLPGTEGAVAPEFSPDGKWIAFGAPDGSLKKLMVDGTSLTTLCQVDVSGIAGLTWTSNREVVFTRVNLTGRGLWRVPADGGQPVEFSQFDSESGERLQLSPRSTPDGKLVFYSSTRASVLDLKIGVASTASGKTKVFTNLLGARVLGFSDGFLIYVADRWRAHGRTLRPRYSEDRSTAPDPRQHRDAWLAVARGACRQWGTALPARGTDQPAGAGRSAR